VSPKKNILKRGFKAEAEKISNRLRNELNLKPNDKLCAFDLANHLEVRVFIPKELGFSGQEEKKLLHTSGWSAFSSEKDGKYFIIHNNAHSDNRQQSNIMHELAHIICKHKIPPEKLKFHFLSTMRCFDPQQEAEAEHLGSVLQLPRDGLLYHLKKSKTTEEIANHFTASVKMTSFRINSSGLKRQLSFTKYR
jgi:Zn-dependent peptidase ImmA (M78 family)